MIITRFTSYLRESISIINKVRWDFSKDDQTHDYIYGTNSVEAVMHSHRRNLITLYLSDSQHIQLSSKATQLMKHAKTINLPIVFTHKDKMSRMVRQQPHQNIILKCSQLKPVPWQTQTPFADGIYVYCDKITDPQNFGAILRSCLFFGVTTIFTGKKHHCPLNQTVSKTSAGALDLINTLMVDNSSEFLSNWKQNGGTVVATSVDEKRHHVSAHQLRGVLQKDNISKILLIFGSEGQGVSPHLVNGSDYTVAITRIGPSKHPYNVVDSLNVSAALATILFQLTRPN